MVSASLVAILMLDMAGAAMRGERVVTWGDQIIEWSIPQLRPRVLVSERVPRGEGGCLVEGGVLVQEGVPMGKLVLHRGPAFAGETLDVNVEMHDCLAATLLGRKGVLVIQRYAQVRFYEPPEHKGDRWPYKEIYSIYTPAREGGLLVTDVDGDGLPDIVVGNYWMRSPADIDLPWPEFAINTWSETPDSATLRILRNGTDLIVAQGHKDDARLAVFSPPADITQLWNDRRIREQLHLRKPHALAMAGRDLIVGENDGPGSRLFVFRDLDRAELLGTTNGVHTVFVAGGRVLTVGRREIRWWPLVAGQREGLRR